MSWTTKQDLCSWCKWLTKINIENHEKTLDIGKTAQQLQGIAHSLLYLSNMGGFYGKYQNPETDLWNQPVAEHFASSPIYCEPENHYIMRPEPIHCTKSRLVDPEPQATENVSFRESDDLDCNGPSCQDLFWAIVRYAPQLFVTHCDDFTVILFIFRHDDKFAEEGNILKFVMLPTLCSQQCTFLQESCNCRSDVAERYYSSLHIR